MTEFWDERYGKAEYAYGEEPNEYLKKVLMGMEPGSILFPAEGEGRNAVFAAGLGWKVSAFDQSPEGRKKAILLAEKRGVEIDYVLCRFDTMSYKTDEFDAIALIFVHILEECKVEYLQKFRSYLKPGGVIIIEGFSKRQIEYQKINDSAGGPRDIGMLYSIGEIESVFNDFEIIELAEIETELNEGKYHIGRSGVVRFIGRKK